MHQTSRQRPKIPTPSYGPVARRVVKAGESSGEKLAGSTGARKKKVATLSRSSTPQRPEILTPRELVILGMVCDGDINREIAIKIQISADGVKYHLQKIFDKLGVDRRTHAIAVAIHAGLIAPQWLVYR